MKPSTMMPLQGGRMQEGTYVFHLTPQQATEIASGKDVVGTSNKLDFVIQVILVYRNTTYIRRDSSQIDMSSDDTIFYG